MAYTTSKDVMVSTCLRDCVIIDPMLKEVTTNKKQSKYSGKVGEFALITPEGTFTKPLNLEGTGSDDLNVWIHGHSIPLLIKFDQSKAPELFGGK